MFGQTTRAKNSFNPRVAVPEDEGVVTSECPPHLLAELQRVIALADQHIRIRKLFSHGLVNGRVELMAGVRKDV